MIAVGIIIPEIKVKGDGVSTAVTFSQGEWPFPVKPPGKLVEVLLQLHPFEGDAVSFDSKTMTVEFAQLFSDIRGISFTAFYDPT